MATPYIIKVSPPPATMGGVPDGDKGDVVVSVGGSVWSFKSSVVSTFARTLLDDLTAAAMRATLGLGGAAILEVGTSSGTVAAGNDSRFITDGDKGDITVSVSGSSWTIDNGVVTLAKMANMATASLIGRNTAGTGVPEVLSAATVKTMLALNLVENTALSTWVGSSNISTLGVITAGTWQGSAISKTYLAGLSKFEIAEATVASASTCDIGGATSDNVLITGTTGITSFGTGTAGVRRYLRFSGILTITHNATSLILPTAANITTAVGDSAIVECLSAGNWKVLVYQRQDGSALLGSGSGVTAAELGARLAGAFGGVTFDNVTVNQRGYTSLLDWNVGTSDFSIVTKLDVPTVAPASNAPIWALSSANNAVAPLSCSCRLEASTGSLQLALSGTTQDSYRRYYYNNFLATYGGQTVFLTVVRLNGTISIFVDGTDITASFSEFTNAGSGVMPASWAESISSAWLLIGGIGASAPGYAGRIARVTPFNYALSSTQIGAFRTGGVAVSEQLPYVVGTNAILNVEKNGVFSKGIASDWVPTGGGTSISTGGAVVLGSAGTNVSLSGLSGYIAQLVPGQLYQLSFDISASTFGANSITAYWGLGVSDTSIPIASANANGSFVGEFTPSFGVGVLSLIANIGGSSFTLSNVKIVRKLLTNGSFETSGSPIGSWTTSIAGSSTVTRDTTNQRSGSACAALNVVAGAASAIQQTALTVGRLYRIGFWAKCTTTSKQAVACDGGTVNYTAPFITTSWAYYTVDFVATTTVLQMKRGTGVGDYTIYLDDVEIWELGAVGDFSAAGLDTASPLWRNSNTRFFDATLSNFVQDSSGTWNGIHNSEGRPWVVNDQLNRLGRESGSSASGGIYLPGNSNQRLTISNGPSIGANAFWVRMQFCMPAVAPASNRGLFHFSGSAVPATGANVFTGYIDTNGDLAILLYGASGSDYRKLLCSDVITRYGGKVVDLIIHRTTVGGLACWVNTDKQFGLETVAGNPPTWLGSVTSTYINIAANSTTACFTGNLHRFQLGRGDMTDKLIRQLLAGGIGTGAGASSGTPISRGGIMASTDGLVLETDLTLGWGIFYPDVAAPVILSTAPSVGAFVALSNLGDETHIRPSYARRNNYADANRRFSGAVANGSTGVTAQGDTFTVQGTPSSSAADANQPQCVNVASAASVGALAGYYTSAIHYVANHPRSAAIVRLVDLTNMCAWVGFHNGTANALNNTDTPTLSMAAFRFSPTRAGDTNWMCVTNNAGTATVFDTGIAANANLVVLEIEIISGQRVNFYIDGRLVKSQTLTLPSSTASCRWQELVEARAASAVNIKFVQVDISTF